MGISCLSCAGRVYERRRGLIPLDPQLGDDWLTGVHGLRLSAARRRALVGDREIPLTRTTFDVLALLLHKQGTVVATEDLVSEVWGHSDAHRPGFARTAVYRLRKELREAGAGDPIEAIRGVGFRIAAAEPDVPTTGDFDAREALASSAAAIYVLTPEHKMIWANQAAERLSGYNLDELLALRSTTELSAAIEPELYERMHHDVRSGRTLYGPTKLLRKDRQVLDLSASWRPVIDADGRVRYTIVEMWDDGATAPLGVPVFG